MEMQSGVEHLPERPALSAVQQQVLEHVATGLTYLQIAERLSMPHKSVTRHVLACRTKLDASNKVQLVARAYRAGLLPPRARP